MPVEVKTYHLEMTSPLDLRPNRPPGSDVGYARVEKPMPELNRFFYTAVGGDWYWLMRLPWNYLTWMDYLDRPELETWVMSVAGVPAGYFEQELQPGNDVEIRSFGLLPPYIGRGLGGAMLTFAVERAWSRGARRVWLHTCSLDHPTALAHYQARGFRLFRTDVSSEELPTHPPGPWPGSGPKGFDTSGEFRGKGATE